VRPDGTGSIVKHYSMGRFSHELAVVLPDERTVLFGDDATNAGYFMYVANQARDLSAGTLYAAKLTSAFSLDPAAAAARLSWIKLGSATDAEVWALADSLLVADIFNISTANPNDASFTKIFVSGRVEYVKLKPGMEKAAAFLESRRYAALLGATMQFSKLEGVTFNAKDKVFYSAIQNVQSSMVAGHVANDAAGFVSLGAAVQAGAVTRSTLAGGQVDRSGGAIDSAWVPTDLGTLLAGKDISADALGNTADPTIIANPDNLKFSEAFRTLFIGEDCSQHTTCMLWAFNVDTKEYARIATVPSGAEATGLSVEDNINGFSYITAAFQHAGEWQSGSVHANVKAAADPLIRKNYKNLDAAAVGYLKSVTASGSSAVQLQTSLKAPVVVETITAPMTRLSFGGIDYPRAADLNVGRASQRLPRRRARERARQQRVAAPS
jgi:secreted PhoX family phosphatase